MLKSKIKSCSQFFVNIFMLISIGSIEMYSKAELYCHFCEPASQQARPPFPSCGQFSFLLGRLFAWLMEEEAGKFRRSGIEPLVYHLYCLIFISPYWRCFWLWLSFVFIVFCSSLNCNRMLSCCCFGCVPLLVDIISMLPYTKIQQYFMYIFVAISLIFCAWVRVCACKWIQTELND